MKKFLLTVTAYILLLAILICGINELYLARNPDDNLGVSYYQNMPQTIHICNFGSSHGIDAFYYDDFTELGTFNFAFAAQSLSYDYRLLNHYQDRLTDGSIVFIPISYFSFFGIPETELADFESKNKRYYHVLPPDLIKDYNFITYLYTVPFPAVGAGTNVFSALLKGSSSTEEDDTIRTADMIDLQANASGVYWRHFVNNRQDENGNLIFLEEEVQAVYDMIAICEARNATPILVTTPYLREYTDLVQEKRPDFLPYFHSIIGKICEDTGVRYFDHSLDPQFMDRHDLFTDSDHMNQNGAKLFTQLLMEEIR